MTDVPHTYASTGGIGPRQRLWEAIRAARGEFTCAEIARRAGVSPHTGGNYVRALHAAGILEKTGPARYKLIRDEGIEYPRVQPDGTRATRGLATEQMWRTLRILRGNTNGTELAAYASSPEHPVAEGLARTYLSLLTRAGYCTRIVIGSGRQAGWHARYQLIKNTGPKPPVFCRTNVVFDPNLRRVVWMPEISEEDAIYG
jgi:hypothetical protein